MTENDTKGFTDEVVVADYEVSLHVRITWTEDDFDRSEPADQEMIRKIQNLDEAGIKEFLLNQWEKTSDLLEFAEIAIERTVP